MDSTQWPISCIKNTKISNRNSSKDSITSNSDSFNSSLHPSFSTSECTIEGKISCKIRRQQEKTKEQPISIKYIPPASKIRNKDSRTKNVRCKKNQTNNIYITDNLTNVNVIHTTTRSYTKILCKNVNGIGSSYSSTLELVCDSARKYNIDIADLSETDIWYSNTQVNITIKNVGRKLMSRKKWSH